MAKKRKGLNLIGIIAVIIFVLIVFFVLKKINYNKIGDLEKIALKLFIEDLNIEYLMNAEDDVKSAKIKCIIDYDSENVNVEKIFKKYKKVFGSNSDVSRNDINKVLNQSIENEELNEQVVFSANKAFKEIKQIEKIADNEFVIIMNVVENIDVEKTIRYYIDNEKINDVNMENLYNDETLDLSEYLDCENYKKLALEIKEYSINVKVINGNIVISNF